MKQWDILEILQTHKEGISSPFISKLIAVNKGIIEHIKVEVNDNQKKQILSLNKQVYLILRRLEAKHLVTSFKIGDGSIYFKLIKAPVDERFNFRCPKCHTIRIGNMGSLLLCSNPNCYQKNGRYNTRFWAKRSRMIL